MNRLDYDRVYANSERRLIEQISCTSEEFPMNEHCRLVPAGVFMSEILRERLPARF